jgi:hypothetical protein
MSDEDKKACSIKLDIPGQPAGVEFSIPGLGTFENGSTYDITEAEAEAYRAYHTKQATVYDAITNEILGAEAQLGPSIADAAQFMPGVEVIGMEPEEPVSNEPEEENEGPSSEEDDQDEEDDL